jgi:hypothetical protein
MLGDRRFPDFKNRSRYFAAIYVSKGEGLYSSTGPQKHEICYSVPRNLQRSKNVVTCSVVGLTKITGYSSDDRIR